MKKEEKLYVAPCVAPKPENSQGVTMTLMVGGIIVLLGGIGNGTNEFNWWVAVVGLAISAWGASRISRPRP